MRRNDNMVGDCVINEFCATSVSGISLVISSRCVLCDARQVPVIVRGPM